MSYPNTVLPNEKQMSPELFGLSTNMISGATGISAARAQMEGNQASQTLVLNNPDYPRTYTCVEQNYSDYTFAARAETTLEIYGYADRYKTGMTKDSFQLNPYTVVIYRDLESRDISYGMMKVPIYFSYHNNFGYMGKTTPSYRKMRRPGASLDKNEVLMDSPGVGPEGFYRRGLLTKCCFLSSPYVAEDGYWVGDDWCKRAASTGISSIIAVLPKGHYLLNIYGTPEEPKYIPSLGEKIRPDGMLLCTREHDSILDLYQLTPEAFMEPDYTFDEPRFIEASCRNATVIDIDLAVNESEFQLIQPVLTDSDGNEIQNQISKLWEEKKRYSRDITDICDRLKSEAPRGRTVNLTPELNQELNRAMHVSMYRDRIHGTPRNIIFDNHGTAINTVWIKITFKYDIIPEIGSKLAGDFGDKGVICRKTPTDWLPRDIYGTQSDMVVHANATFNRMIPVRLDDNYLGAQCILKENEIRRLYDEGNWREAFNVVAEFLKVATPRPYKEKFVKYFTTDERKKKHVESIYNGHIMLEIKQNDTPNLVELTAALEAAWPYKRGKLTFKSTRGITKTTMYPGIIGTNYVRVLEKTGHDWGAVDAAKRQAHGLAAKIGHRDRHSRPYRQQPFRYGESEFRPIVAITEDEFGADLLDRANNPLVQEEIFTNIMESERPSDIYQIVDRKKNPIGSSVTHQYLNNALYCMGARFVRRRSNKKGPGRKKRK